MQVSVRLVACLALVGASAWAQTQNLFVLPGKDSNSQNVLVYAPQPFAPGSGFVAGASSFLVLAKPDGSKYYTIANSGAQTVTVINSGFANPRSLGNLGLQATNAVITPDGSKFFVAADSLQEFETTGDTNFGTITIGSNVHVFDVAMSLDGSKVFTLGSIASGGSQLNSVDIAGNRVVGTLAIPGVATAVAVGPNGMVYVCTQNEIVEVDPTSLTVSAGGIIQLNARPGRPAFTPDGKYLIAPNQTPITGSSVLFVDLTSRTLAGFIPNFNVVIDSILPASSNQVFAYSSQTQSLLTISINTGPSFVINPYSLPGTNPGPISSAALSNEVPGAGRTTVQYLFAAQDGILYRVDLTTNTTSGQFPLPAATGGNGVAGTMQYAGAAFTGTPLTLLQFGGGQSLAPGATSHPIVVRALDGNGHALSGVTVTWATNASNAAVTPASSVTGADGYAVTYLTAPSTSGVVVVSATAGGQVVAFNIGVGTGTGGSAGGITIVAGQGQLVSENFNTENPDSGSPLVVQVTDVNGKTVAGVPVTFTVAQGAGTVVEMSGVSTGSPNAIQVTTDDKGRAQVGFLSSLVFGTGTGFIQTIVSASAPGTNSVNFYITTTPSGLTGNQTGSPAQVELLKPGFGDTIVGQAGTTLPGAVSVRVVSSFGVPIPNVSVRVHNGALDSASDASQFPDASCLDASGLDTLTDASGVASCNLRFNGKIGSFTTRALVGYSQLTSTFNIQVTSGPPGKINILQGNNQTGTPGQTLPQAFLVQVTDSFGNVLSGVPVTWQVLTTGAVTLSNVSSATDGSGRASALGTLGSIAGNAQVKVTAGTVSATFTVTVNIPASGLTKVSGDGQTTIVNTQFTNPLVVKVVDSKGAGITGIQVSFQVSSGAATVQTPTASTDSTGQASTRVTAGSSAGNIVITASFANFSATFNLTSRLPGAQNINIVNGASFLPGISPGSVALITGTGILTGVQGLYTAAAIVGPLPTSFPIPSSIGTGSITFNGLPAPVYFVSNSNGQEQVAVQIPFEVQPGNVSMTINSVGGGNTSVTILVAAYSPGVFETVYSGKKYAVATRPDGSAVSPSNPARRGENIRIYATGLGQVKPSAGTNTVGIPGQSVIAPLIAGLNNGGVPLVAAEYAQGLVGVDVITIQVPSDTQTGSAQPVGLIVYDANNNAVFAQGTFIAIQ